jgi:hypothetical protein
MDLDQRIEQVMDLSIFRRLRLELSKRAIRQGQSPIDGDGAGLFCFSRSRVREEVWSSSRRITRDQVTVFTFFEARHITPCKAMCGPLCREAIDRNAHVDEMNAFWWFSQPLQSLRLCEVAQAVSGTGR